jgi:tryptophan halogenase
MKVVILGAGTAGVVTALILREKYPTYDITVVKSGEIGIIGVGEGSTEHWADLMRFIGIDLSELFTRTKATVKIGILFKDWIPGKQYVHSISRAELSGLNRPEVYNQLLLNDNGTKFPLSGNFESIFYKNNIPIIENLQPANQYHFDAFALNDFLVELCQKRNISFIDCKIEDVKQASNGYITALTTSGNDDVEGDFFIDCSGFKRVLSEKVGCKWVSMSRYLPMNHAIAFPTEFDNKEDIEPYTTSTALSAGWSWKIPTQERYGNGYVFCDSYISADQALNEISLSLGKEIEKAARDIKFEAGCVDKFWNKNVVSVGLASSFAEPLEAQSIGFTIIQARLLADCIDTWELNSKISEVYNARLKDSFDNIISYLQLHYLTPRDDTEFWQDKPFELTSFNRDNIDAFKAGVFAPALFDGNSYMFRIFNWYQVMAGLELIDKEKLTKQLQGNLPQYNNVNYRKALEIQNQSNHGNKVSHKMYIDIVKNNLRDSIL